MANNVFSFTNPQFNKMGMSAGLGAMGAGLGGLLAPYTNPADAASPYLNQIEGTIKPYYTPYIEAGQKALPTLQEQFQGLIDNPTNALQKFGSNFQQSPGYQWNFNQAMNAAENAAAAGGMAGTPQHQQQAATMASGLANQDYYNFLDHALNMYMKGLGGFGDLNQTGFNASTSLADSLASMLLTQSQLAYSGAMNENEQQGEGFGSLLSGAASLAPFFLL